MPFESVHHVHGGHGLTSRVLGVRNGVPDDDLQKDLEDTTSLLVNQPTNTLHATSPSQATDCGLGDALDVVAQHLPVTLGAALSQALPSFAASRHGSQISQTKNPKSLRGVALHKYPIEEKMVRMTDLGV